MNPAPLARRWRVRYAECDQQGVVFNAHYLAWCDDNMTELWRAGFGGYMRVVERGADIVVAAADLAFRSPARFDDLLDITVAVAHMGTTSLVTRHAIALDDRPIVEAELRHVFVDPATLTKMAIPDWVREGLGRWVMTAV